MGDRLYVITSLCYLRLWQIVTESTKNGNVIARVRATDADAGANAVLTYSLEGDSHQMFSIGPETGEIRLEKNRVGPDSSSYELGRETVYHLVVVATDGGVFTFRITTTTTTTTTTTCLLYTSPSPRDGLLSRMPSSA